MFVYFLLQGMKKYNTQLVEVKRELKSCKTKMDTQNKQVQKIDLSLMTSFMKYSKDHELVQVNLNGGGGTPQ